MWKLHARELPNIENCENLALRENEAAYSILWTLKIIALSTWSCYYSLSSYVKFRNILIIYKNYGV